MLQIPSLTIMLPGVHYVDSTMVRKSVTKLVDEPVLVAAFVSHAEQAAVQRAADGRGSAQRHGDAGAAGDAGDACGAAVAAAEQQQQLLLQRFTRGEGGRYR
jgi:hypothetical protein